MTDDYSRLMMEWVKYLAVNTRAIKGANLPSIMERISSSDESLLKQYPQLRPLYELTHQRGLTPAQVATMSDEEFAAAQEAGNEYYDMLISLENYERYMELIHEHLSPGGDWLDVGCGQALYTSFLMKHGWIESLVGVDPSQTMLRRAQELTSGIGNCEFFCGMLQMYPGGRKFRNILLLDTLNW